MKISILQERPDSPEARQLIDELEATLAPHYPAESRHGYSVEKLIQQGVAFFVMRQEGIPLGCGGVQLYGSEYGELKRMYIRPNYRGRGLGKLLLDHLAAYTQQQGVHLLRLETGIHQTAAIRLYESYGFRPIPPFGDYQPDPLSVFYEKYFVASPALLPS